MNRYEHQSSSVSNKNRLTTTEPRSSYASIALLVTAVLTLLTACDKQGTSPTDIQKAINDQLTASPTSALTITETPIQTNTPIPTATPLPPIETVAPTITATLDSPDSSTNQPEIAPPATPTPESAANLYFKVPFELSPHQERAMQAVQSGSFLEIRGINNGADLCDEEKCFRAELDVQIGLSGISIAATGPFVSAYKPESPLSNDPQGYTEGSVIVSWPTDTYLNLHNRDSFRYMRDSAWANSEALKLEDDARTVVSETKKHLKKKPARKR